MPNSEISIRNRKLVRIQAFWGGSANGAWVIFGIPYLLRLDASITLISIYVAITALGPLVIGPIAVTYLQHGLQQRRWMIVCGVFSRIFFILPATAVLFPSHRAEIAIIIFSIGAVPTIIFGALWSPIPGIVVVLEHRPRIINSRTRIANSGALSANALAGIGMITLTFPYNYTTVFVMSGILGFIEMYVISLIVLPKREVQIKDTIREKFDLRGVASEKQFVTFMIGIALIATASSIVMPLQSVLFIKERGYSDRWMGLWAMVMSLGVVLGSLIWKNVQKRIGSYAILSFTVPLAAFYFLFIVIAPNQYWVILSVLYVGMMNAGTDVGVWLALYRFGTAERRSLLINIFIGISLGIPFVSAFFIPALTQRFTLTQIFIGSFIVRFAVGLYFKIPRVYNLLKEDPPIADTDSEPANKGKL
jgi:MFS family permease